MRYEIGEVLAPWSDETARDAQFVAVLTRAEWAESRDVFDMGIDIEPDWNGAVDTQAEENYDSITGVIRVLDRGDLSAEGEHFAFALDEKGIVLIDDGDAAARLVGELAGRRWRNPGLERLLYDLVLALVNGDAQLLEEYERELDRMEESVLAGGEGHADRVNEIRGDLRDLDSYYEHLQDFAAVLEENENGFFDEASLRYFRLLDARLEKLRDKARSLREQAQQVRDLYKMHLDIRQNNIMTVLTVVTAIFAPLTLIVGWYGMNFAHMPELAWRYSYPVLAVVCLVIALAMIAYFKRRRWL